MLYILFQRFCYLFAIYLILATDFYLAYAEDKPSLNTGSEAGTGNESGARCPSQTCVFPCPGYEKYLEPGQWWVPPVLLSIPALGPIFIPKTESPSSMSGGRLNGNNSKYWYFGFIPLPAIYGALPSTGNCISADSESSSNRKLAWICLGVCQCKSRQQVCSNSGWTSIDQATRFDIGPFPLCNSAQMCVDRGSALLEASCKSQCDTQVRQSFTSVSQGKASGADCYLGSIRPDPAGAIPSSSLEHHICIPACFENGKSATCG